MPRQPTSLTPRQAVELVERQRAKRRELTAAYRQRKISAGAKTVQVFVPDEAAVKLVRQVAAAMRTDNPTALARLAESVRSYRPSGQQPLLDSIEVQ